PVVPVGAPLIALGPEGLPLPAGAPIIDMSKTGKGAPTAPASAGGPVPGQPLIPGPTG
ncbi:MAG: beta-xylosidase, partial [Mycobacterium sp.]